MDGMKVKNVSAKSLQLGDNLFETATITLTDGAVLPIGAVLRREGEGFAPAEADDAFCAVNPVEIKNTTGAEKAFSIRALIGGLVRADMVGVDGSPLTAADRDKLRGYGIVAVKVMNLSQLDNQ